MNIKVASLLGLIIILGTVLRFIGLGNIPPGLSIDEASLGIDAYSLLTTGKDQYGQTYPIFFRSFATYQSPLYTYLTILPVALIGFSAQSVRIVSVVSSLLVILFTFYIIKKLKVENGNELSPSSKEHGFEFLSDDNKLALIGALLVAIAPWSIFVGRMAVEADVALMLVVLSVWLSVSSLNRPKLILLMGFVLGIATYAYHGQRLLSGLFLFSFLLVFHRQFLMYKKWVIAAIIIFILCLGPQLMIATSTGSLRRFQQTNYLDNLFFQKNGGILRSIPLGHQIFIVREFTTQYFEYFSPRSLFFDPDPQPERSIPDLSVFYSWMIIPFIFGVRYVVQRRLSPGIKVLLLLMLVAPIPASLTRDPFYTLRALPLFWILNIFISFGFYDILIKIKQRGIRVLISVALITWSLLIFYINYFILFKYERSDYTFGFPFAQFIELTNSIKDKTFILDYSAQPSSYIWVAFYKHYDPLLLQEELKKKIKLGYYQDNYFDPFTNIGNVEVRHIVWGEACKKKILVGDLSVIPDEEVAIRKFELVKEFKDLQGKTILRAFTLKDKTCY